MCTCCENDPEKAHIPFILGNAALATDINAMIALQGDAVKIATKGYAETMPRGGGFAPMKELLDSFMALGGELGICGPCIKHRDIPESDLIEGGQNHHRRAGKFSGPGGGCRVCFLIPASIAVWRLAG